MNSLLTITEAARELGVGRVTIWNSIQRGELIAERIGNILVIQRDSLPRFVRYRVGRPTDTFLAQHGRQKAPAPS